MPRRAKTAAEDPESMETLICCALFEAGIFDYSGTRVDVSRNRSVQVDATTRFRVPANGFLFVGWRQRRPCTILNRI
jgi:hypothetical protein